ncbi:MAG TPA: aminotransferase class V-fold PLP-dependent enzyme, partial [Chloroflexota bacterium]
MAVSDVTPVAFPVSGRSLADLHHELGEASQGDARWKERLAAGVSYPAGDDVLQIALDAYGQFFSANALYPRLFPSLARFEYEVVSMSADLLHGGPTATGNITSGGSESILLGVKSARDRARALRPEIIRPQMVVPESAHPAFWKAAHYFGLDVIKIPLRRDDWQVDLDAYRAAVNDNTVLLVGSAPSLILGMIDPIPEMAAIAAERDINFHVDACVGGYFLPFVEQLGTPLTTFDFRVPGVTTISADLHKFGYAAKGASMILSRDSDIYQYQPFDFGPPERPAGWYHTPTMAGTRPGGVIAAAWAVLNYLGRDGYLRLVGQTMGYIRRFQADINSTAGLEVLGQPAMTVFAYTSRTIDIFAVADGLEDRGWLVWRESVPFQAIRFMQSPGHEPFVAAYIRDLREVVQAVERGDL